MQLFGKSICVLYKEISWKFYSSLFFCDQMIWDYQLVLNAEARPLAQEVLISK